MNWSAILSPQKLHRISFMRSKALTYMYLLFTIFQLAIHSFHCFYYSTMKEPLFSRFWLWRSVWIAFHSNERNNAAFFFFFHPWIARMAHVQNANTQWTYMRFSLVVFFLHIYSASLHCSKWIVDSVVLLSARFFVCWIMQFRSIVYSFHHFRLLPRRTKQHILHAMHAQPQQYTKFLWNEPRRQKKVVRVEEEGYSIFSVNA